ncbi:hypothetical protein RRG08_026955 [Elysia crispata]|uniref:Uncharacterized protein n=1 Tax=Elysia crispata TaxID=231223 RepID=A0AAE0YQC7_9GAST|nr:hypothetical protein RRG08_026955 [Elysia crispata]
MKFELTLCVLVILGSLHLASADPIGRDKRFIKAVAKTFTKTVDKAGDLVDKGKSKTKDFVDDVGDGVKGIAGDVGDGVKDVAGDVGDGVKDAAKYTTKVSKTIGKGVSSISQKSYRTAYNKAKKTFNSIKGLVGKG